MRIGMRSILAGLAAIAGGALALTGPASASVTPNAVTFVQIVNFHSGKCVDVDGGSQRPGTVVQQFSCNGTVAQLWRMMSTGSGYFELIVAASGQCMTVDNAGAGSGIHQQPCQQQPNQQWTSRSSGVPGWPMLVSGLSGKGLTIKSESLLDRAPLVQDTIGDDGPGALHAGDWQFQ